MELKGFKKMSIKKQENVYGGWAWMTAVVAAAPFILEGILSLTSSYKALLSDEGSIKTNKGDVKWSNHKTSSTKKTSSKTTSTKEARRIFYVF